MLLGGTGGAPGVCLRVGKGCSMEAWRSSWWLDSCCEVQGGSGLCCCRGKGWRMAVCAGKGGQRRLCMQIHAKGKSLEKQACAC